MYLYSKEMLNKFKYPFYGIENIEKNYSQSLQDMFVLSVLNGKRNGTFLEIGAYLPTYLSNTRLLEDYGWDGISIDRDDMTEKTFREFKRKATVIIGDATKFDYLQMLNSCDKFDQKNKQIDYLQIDVDPMQISLEALKQIPLDEWKFSAVTFEHDNYDPHTPREIADAVREESRQILQSHGYILVNGNVENLGNDNFEDWWILEESFDKSIIDKFMRKDDAPMRACVYFGLEK